MEKSIIKNLNQIIINMKAVVQKNVWPLIESGKFKPVIFKTFPFSEAAEAHRLLEKNTHTGKIILV